MTNLSSPSCDMMMRRVKFVSMLLIGVIVLASCKTNNDVVSNGFLQKRKHRSGFHLNLKSKAPQEVAKVSVEKTHQLPTRENLEAPEKLPKRKAIVQLPTKPEAQSQTEYTASVDIDAESFAKQKPGVLRRMHTSSDPEKDKFLHPSPAEKSMVDFKKGSEMKRRSSIAFWLSMLGAVLFTVIAINFFAAFLPFSAVLPFIIQMSLLVSGLLLSWKYKDVNGLSRAAFFISWIFIGLTALFYLVLIFLGMLAPAEDSAE